MAQYIVNKSGTVHSIPEAWLAEKLASGYRLANQDEIDAHFHDQGLKDSPKSAELERAYKEYQDGARDRALSQSTTIGPRPGDVDVRMTRPGDPGFVVGTDGMRQVPSQINPQTANEAVSVARDVVQPQDAHVYEPVVPDVARAAVDALYPAPAPEVAAMARGLDNEVQPAPTAQSGPAPLDASSDPNAAVKADAEAAKADADSGSKSSKK